MVNRWSIMVNQEDPSRTSSGWIAGELKLVDEVQKELLYLKVLKGKTRGAGLIPGHSGKGSTTSTSGATGSGRGVGNKTGGPETPGGKTTQILQPGQLHGRLDWGPDQQRAGGPTTGYGNGPFSAGTPQRMWRWTAGLRGVWVGYELNNGYPLLL